MIKFRDEADARRDILRKKDLEELKAGKETIEASRSQAQITWDQHEKVSSELAVVRGELEKSLADLQEETQKSMLHRREINNVLLQLSTEAHRVVKAFKELGVPSPPIITVDHARYIKSYPPLFKHIAQLIGDIRRRTRKVTSKAGEVAVCQTITQVVSALHRHQPQLSLLSELEVMDLAAPSPPGTSHQVEKILERLSREDDHDE